MFGGMDLGNYYKLMALLNENHHVSYTEYEDMIPYERDIMVSMINDMLEMRKAAQQN